VVRKIAEAASFAERDATLVQNRITLLANEELKILKKIEKTRQYADKI